MKTLLILCLIAMTGFTIERPVNHRSISYTIAVAPADSSLSAHKKHLRKHHALPVDGVAVASILMWCAALATVGSWIGLLVLLIGSVAFGMWSLVRIDKSRGRLGGRVLAGLSIVLGLLSLASARPADSRIFEFGNVIF